MGTDISLSPVIISSKMSLIEEEEPVEPLTTGNRSKGRDAEKLRREDWTTLPQVLAEEPGFLIGLRVSASVNKSGLFKVGQRGVVTDIHKSTKKLFVVVTWDNEAKTGRMPMQRTVKFAFDKLWKYAEACQ